MGYTRVEDFLRLDWYQVLLQVFNEFAIFTQLSNVVFNVFGAAAPLVVGCPGTDLVFNGTKEERCTAWAEEGQFCDNPLLEYQFYSANVEFQSICGRQAVTWLDAVLGPLGITDKARFSTTLQMIGLVISCLYAGMLSDAWGRKKTLLTCYSAICILQVISSFTTSLDGFILSRFALGLVVGAVLTVTSIFIIEGLPPAHRFWISTTVTWAPNYMLLGLAAWLSHDWRTLARVSAAGNLIAVIILLFIEESPKFLIQKKRKEEAVRALQRINRFSSDKATLHEIRAVVDAECGDAVSTVEKEPLMDSGLALPPPKHKSKTYTFLHLYSSQKIALRTLVCSFTQFALSTITYALMFNMHAIGGSLFLNMFYSGVLRWVVGATAAILDHFGAGHIGRRRMHLITFGAVAFFMVANFFLIITGLSDSVSWAERPMALIAFGITGCIYLQMALVVSELFPTCVRTLANAHLNVCGRIGNVIGPNVFSWNLGVAGLPYGYLAVLSGVEIGMFMVTVPETKNQPLPNELPVKGRRGKGKEAC